MACNYDADALYNDGTCEYDESDCVDEEEFGSASGVEEMIEEYMILQAFSPPLSQTIEVVGFRDANLNVYDLSGKHVSNNMLYEGTKMIIPTHTPGIFLLTAQDDNGVVQTFKVYVN